jgi:hypothetical protein
MMHLHHICVIVYWDIFARKAQQYT